MGLKDILDYKLKVVNPHRAIQEASLKVREVKSERLLFNSQHLIVPTPTAILPYVL